MTIERDADLMSQCRGTLGRRQPVLFEWLWQRFKPFTVELSADVTTACSDRCWGRKLRFLRVVWQLATTGTNILNMD